METAAGNISNHLQVGNHTKSFNHRHNVREGTWTILASLEEHSSDAFDWISRMNCYVVTLLTLIFVEFFTNIGVFEQSNPQPLAKVLLRGGYFVGFIAKVDQFMLHNSP